jgi:hypothetical protein
LHIFVAVITRADAFALQSSVVTKLNALQWLTVAFLDNTALVFFFLIGAIAPVIPWLLTKRYPNSFAKYIK